ncbi:hypothetical protein L2E82_19979 [Cichorium intybus]|uniref:Uncharacterized protein n=1 Tax=Cichorium intybus TaxID=13427 RepID=A0ACB9DRQ3_CICIN|nr:hypothetical protein L2E82_19979 [Cichorium intybus]
MSTEIDNVHISISNQTSSSYTNKKKPHFFSTLFFHIPKNCEHDMKNLIHSFKVGFALLLVSLVYILDPLFEQVGKNALWAIMTVEVIFEFFAGATLSKGLLRGIGTLLGGGLACLASNLARDLGKIGYSIFVGGLIFIFGAMATYCRFIPSIHRRYDYGVTIFILSFNLVTASSLRGQQVMELAYQRLSAVAMGFSVCIFISLLIYPMWATDELHRFTSFKFKELATCIEECVDGYLVVGEKESHPIIHVSSCKSVLDSKSTDESLVNFARWEPSHGRFWCCNPWEKHQQITDLLRELASNVLSLQGCLKSTFQPSTMMREAIKEPCKTVGLTIGLIMRELGEIIMKKKMGNVETVMVPELQSIKLKLIGLSTSNLGAIESVEDLAIANFLFLVIKMVDKVEVLAKEVEALGKVAGFQTK